ncbi:UNVERIFIED_CONTAM: hypothetical protein GTU68_004671 [Idotea baltica]|nr:hypothetical protein [Idotea baltica]
MPLNYWIAFAWFSKIGRATECDFHSR